MGWVIPREWLACVQRWSRLVDCQGFGPVTDLCVDAALNYIIIRKENMQTKTNGEVKPENLRSLLCLACNESKSRGNSSLSVSSGAIPEPISRREHDKTSRCVCLRYPVHWLRESKTFSLWLILFEHQPSFSKLEPRVREKSKQEGRIRGTQVSASDRIIFSWNFPLWRCKLSWWTLQPEKSEIRIIIFVLSLISKKREKENFCVCPSDKPRWDFLEEASIRAWVRLSMS
jgi:hypothetical protein